MNALNNRKHSRIYEQSAVFSRILNLLAQQHETRFSVKEVIKGTGLGRDNCYRGLAAITAEALKLNKDDEIFRSDGVYLREYDPPYDIGSDKVLGNVFLDFNIKVIGIGQ